MSVVASKPTVFLRKSPSVKAMVKTGIVDGALTAPLLMSKRAIPPPSLQLVAICANSVGAPRSRVSARQIRPLAAAGTSAGEAPPWGTNTKLILLIAELMSAGVGFALEVVDQVAGMQFGLMAHPAVFGGCGPPLRISTLFWAASVVMPSKNTSPDNNVSHSFFMVSPQVLHRLPLLKLLFRFL